MTVGVWGSGPWAIGTWGGASEGVLTLLAAVPLRENMVRLVFSMPVYYSEILDRYDASDPEHYSIAVVDGTVDAIGNPTRAVNIIAVEQPGPTSDMPINPAEVGFYVDVILDRPMSSFPAGYTIGVRDLQDVNASSQIDNATINLDATYRELQPPVLEMAAPLRDIASPQTASMLGETRSSDAILGTYVIAEDGDYAFDEGNTGRKKRVIRRLITRKNGFAHLPGYGLGVLEMGKTTARLDTIGKLTTDARLQIEREPDIEKASVTADFATTSLLRLHVAIKPRGTTSQKFTLSVPLR